MLRAPVVLGAGADTLYARAKAAGAEIVLDIKDVATAVAALVVVISKADI